MKRKIINRLLVGILISIWFTYHLVTNAYYMSETGFVWFCGFLIHGSIMVDLVFWIGLIIMFIFLVIIE